MTLYEMTKAAQELYDFLTQSADDETADFDEQAYKDTLEAIGVDEKLVSYAQVLKSMEGDKLVIDAEIERLTKKKKSISSGIDRMKEAVYNFLKLSKLDKTQAGTFSFRINKSQAVSITNENLIPSAYMKPQPPKVNKLEIKKMLKSGVKIPGAELTENESVVIK